MGGTRAINFDMGFTYNFDTNLDLSRVRLMIADTSNSAIPLSGTCNTNGFAVSLLTGDPISTTSTRITINGVQYAIFSVTDDGNLVLTTSAGVQSGVAWSAGRAIFDDEEITQALWINSSQGIYTSGMAVASGRKGIMPIQIYSPYRAAAMLLDSLAANRSLLASFVQILDVKLGPEKAAQELRATAKQWRETAARDGSFAIAEQVQDPFSARQRTWNQILRLQGGG